MNKAVCIRLICLLPIQHLQEFGQTVPSLQCTTRSDAAEDRMWSESTLIDTLQARFRHIIRFCLFVCVEVLRPSQPSGAGLGGAVGCASDWRPRGRGFDPRRGRQHSFVEIDHEIFSTVILSLPLIQEVQLSVSGERMCTILVNRLED